MFGSVCNFTKRHESALEGGWMRRTFVVVLLVVVLGAMFVFAGCGSSRLKTLQEDRVEIENNAARKRANQRVTIQKTDDGIYLTADLAGEGHDRMLEEIVPRLGEIEKDMAEAERIRGADRIFQTAIADTLPIDETKGHVWKDKDTGIVYYRGYIQNMSLDMTIHNVNVFGGYKGAQRIGTIYPNKASEDVWVSAGQEIKFRWQELRGKRLWDDEGSFRKAQKKGILVRRNGKSYAWRYDIE